jgi:flagellar hook protein FlgE
MMRGMYSAISGLKNHQIALDVTANDLANVNTIGYKGAHATFQDSLTQLQKAGSSFNAGTAGANPSQVGLGASLGSITNSMSTGAFQATGNPTDLGIQGDGWFRVAQGDPTAGPASINDMQYTRAGNFTTNNAGYLITQDSRYVIGRTAGSGGTDTFIQIPSGSSDVAVGVDGAVSYVPGGGGPRATAGWLQTAKFANEAGLERSGANRWRATPATGGEVVGTPGVNGYGQTIGGVLEMSNVDLASEFTDMITAQRGFQANSRVISTTDEMLNELVNLKR